MGIFNDAISNLNAQVTIKGDNTTLTLKPFMRDFVLLKAFDINICLPKAPLIKEVLLQPLILIDLNAIMMVLLIMKILGMYVVVSSETKMITSLWLSLIILITPSIHVKFSVVLRAIDIALKKGYMKF